MLLMPSGGRNHTLVSAAGAEELPRPTRFLLTQRTMHPWLMFLTCSAGGQEPVGFHSHPSRRSPIALSSGDSYREHVAAIAAIQLIIKAWLNSHMYFASNCVPVIFLWFVFVWDWFLFLRLSLK